MMKKQHKIQYIKLKMEINNLKKVKVVFYFEVRIGKKHNKEVFKRICKINMEHNMIGRIISQIF